MTSCEAISQRDLRWATMLLGNSDTATIGSHGCLVTAGAWLAGVRPDAMNAALRCAGGFWPNDGRMKRPFAFHMAMAQAPVWTRDVGAAGEFRNAPYPGLEVQKLLAHVGMGEPAIIEVQLQRGQHFVATAGISDGRLMVMDPWHGDVVDICSRYGATLALAICGASWFETMCARPRSVALPPARQGGRKFKHDRTFIQ